MLQSIRDRFLEDENNYNFNLDFIGILRGNDFVSDEDNSNNIIPYPYTPLYNDTSVINLNDLESDFLWWKLVKHFSIKLS